MDDEDVGGLGDEGSLGNVHLLLAATALVVVDDLALHHLLQTLLHALDAFHRQRQIIIILDSILYFPALLADQLTARLTPKHRLQEVLPGRRLQSILNSIEKHIEELLGILLLGDVGGHPIEFLEGEAELPWVVVTPI